MLPKVKAELERMERLVVVRRVKSLQIGAQEWWLYQSQGEDSDMRGSYSPK